MPRGVHASVVRKPEARLVERLHLLRRFMQPPHTAKRGFLLLHRRPARPERPASPTCPPPSLISASWRSSTGCRQRVGPAPSHVEIGIGDDAAAIAGEPGTVSVVTTDALVEGVHFRRDWTAARAIGHKALAVNLSDLAAMGAAPRASLLEPGAAGGDSRSTTSTRSSTATSRWRPRRAPRSSAAISPVRPARSS